MKERVWTVRIDRHDDTGTCLDTDQFKVTGPDSTAARQQARERLMDEYDTDWSITSVRRASRVKVAS